MVDCTLHTAVVHVASPTDLPVFRFSRPPFQRKKTRAHSRVEEAAGRSRPQIKFALEIDLSIAVKIGREIRWPMVIERGGEMVEENTLRDDVALRGSEEERVRE